MKLFISLIWLLSEVTFNYVLFKQVIIVIDVAKFPGPDPQKNILLTLPPPKYIGYTNPGTLLKSIECFKPLSLEILATIGPGNIAL